MDIKDIEKTTIDNIIKTEKFINCLLKVIIIIFAIYGIIATVIIVKLVQTDSTNITSIITSAYTESISIKSKSIDSLYIINGKSLSIYNKTNSNIDLSEYQTSTIGNFTIHHRNITDLKIDYKVVGSITTALIKYIDSESTHQTLTIKNMNDSIVEITSSE